MRPNTTFRAALLCGPLLSSVGFAAEAEVNLWTGEGVTVGRIFAPEVSFVTALGGSTAEDGELAVGHHDPDRDGITLQNVEFSLAANLGTNIALIGYYVGKVDLDDHWDDEFEEYYLRWRGLPLDAQLRAGRLYTKFGFQNPLHPHDFIFVDQYLVNGRLLGDDSATVHGAELSVPLLRSLPSAWTDRLTVSYGEVPSVDEHHTHGHTEEEEALFDGESAAFARRLATVDYSVTFSPSKTSEHQFGVSAAWGRNGFDRQTQVYGLHWQSLWRFGQATDGKRVCTDHDHAGHDHSAHSHHDHETGEGGAFLRWRTEVMVRRFGAVGSGHDDHAEHEAHEEHEAEARELNEEEEHHDEEEEEAPPRALRRTLTDAGFSTALTYGFPNGRVQAHLRGDYMSGVAEAGLSERWRISPAVSWRPSEKLPISFVLQYNYDRSPSFGEEHSVWAQFRLSWGESGAHQH